MHVRLALCCTLLCCLVITAETQAWGPAGHKIVASIAFRRLSPDQQKKIVALLKKHPRFEDDFAPKMEVVDRRFADEWIVEQAAIWPDLARGISDPGKRQKYHRGTWHFINLPHYLTDADERVLKDGIRDKVNISFDVPTDTEGKKSMNVVQAIAHSKSIVMDPKAEPEERALHLSWLIHLVGDIHQPLHSTALFSRELFPDGDQGGNKIPTNRSRNLHSVWDGFPGSPQFTTTRNRAIKLLNDSEMKDLGEKAAEVQDVIKWLDESHMLAKTEAYDGAVMGFLREQERNRPNSDLPQLELSEDYLHRGGEIARRRLVQAGYRLGKLLEAVP
jgi:S1/P1 Nuclease